MKSNFEQIHGSRRLPKRVENLSLIAGLDESIETDDEHEVANALLQLHIVDPRGNNDQALFNERIWERLERADLLERVRRLLQ